MTKKSKYEQWLVWRQGGFGKWRQNPSIWLRRKEETNQSEGLNNGLEVVECCDRLLGSLFTVTVTVLSSMNKIITRTPHCIMQLNNNSQQQQQRPQSNNDTKYSLKAIRDLSQHLFDTVSTIIQHCKIHKMSIISGLWYWIALHFIGVIVSTYFYRARVHDVCTTDNTSGEVTHLTIVLCAQVTALTETISKYCWIYKVREHRKWGYVTIPLYLIIFLFYPSLLIFNICLFCWGLCRLEAISWHALSKKRGTPFINIICRS